jgi:long-chain acyl-CoA synthetase
VSDDPRGSADPIAAARATDGDPEGPAPSLAELTGADPHAIALAEPGRALTWAELEARTNALGHGLVAAGLEPGDHVVLAASNRLEFFVALLGAMRAGFVVTPVKTGLTIDEVSYIVGDAGTRAIVADVDGARRAAAATGTVLVDLDAGGVPAGGTPTHDGFEAWLADQPTSPHPLGRHGYRMSYTSGTTGRPKGVVRFVDGRVPWCDGFRASAGFLPILHLPTDGPHCNVSALFHGAPLAFSLGLLAAGVEVRIVPRWQPDLVLDLLQDGVRSTIMVPTMFRQLLALPEERREAFHAPELTSVVHGGEPCPQPVKAAMIAWWGPILTEYYGMTEGGMTVATSEEWLAKPGTVGRATRGMALRILDDDGHEVPTGEEGTIYFANPAGRFFEYRGAPDKTEAAHTTDGAFTVGDRGYVDDDGYLFISGRSADLIVSSGVNVYPAEIEDVLYALDEVADACVVGAPDDLRGECVAAFVVLTAGTDHDAGRAAVERACEERLAGYKRPRRLELVDAVPRDPTGKLLRHVLRAQVWEGRSGFAASRP